MVEQRFNRLNRSSNASQSDRRRQVRGRLIAAFAAAFFFSVSAMGCEEGTTGPTPAGSFQATITGDVVADYQGSGDFWWGTRPPGPDRHTIFQIHSEGTGASADQQFRVYHRRDAIDQYLDGLITEGTYPLTVFDLRDTSARGTSVFFTETKDGAKHYYMATSGSVTITASSEDRVAGKFSFLGSKFCEYLLNATERQPGCPPPTSVSSEAPTIDVSGSFTAIPSDNEAVSLNRF